MKSLNINIIKLDIPYGKPYNDMYCYVNEVYFLFYFYCYDMINKSSKNKNNALVYMINE